MNWLSCFNGPINKGVLFCWLIKISFLSMRFRFKNYDFFKQHAIFLSENVKITSTKSFYRIKRDKKRNDYTLYIYMGLQLWKGVSNYIEIAWFIEWNLLQNVVTVLRVSCDNNVVLKNNNKRYLLMVRFTPPNANLLYYLIWHAKMDI